MRKHKRTLTLENYRPTTLAAFLASLVPDAEDRAIMREMAIARVMAEPPVPIGLDARSRGIRADGRNRPRLGDGRDHPITITRGNAKVTVSARNFRKVRERREASGTTNHVDAQRQSRLAERLASLGSQADYD